MSGIGTSALSKWAESHVWLFHGVHPLAVGEFVRVRTWFSPLSGQTGRIVDLTPGDVYGSYLVRFDNGLQFRYQRNELAPTSNTDSAREDR
jgi:hypothetical protein